MLSKMAQRHVRVPGEMEEGVQTPQRCLYTTPADIPLVGMWPHGHTWQEEVLGNVVFKHVTMCIAKPVLVWKTKECIN